MKVSTHLTLRRASDGPGFWFADHQQILLASVRNAADAQLADSRFAAGNVADARAAWEQAIAILDQIDHPDVERVRTKLGDTGTRHRASAETQREQATEPGSPVMSARSRAFTVRLFEQRSALQNGSMAARHRSMRKTAICVVDESSARCPSGRLATAATGRAATKPPMSSSCRRSSRARISPPPPACPSPVLLLTVAVRTGPDPRPSEPGWCSAIRL